MSEARDYGLGGATPLQLYTPQPTRTDIEAQSAPSPLQSQERGIKHPSSPVVGYLFKAALFRFVLHLRSQDIAGSNRLQDIFVTQIC